MKLDQAEDQTEPAEAIQALKDRLHADH